MARAKKQNDTLTPLELQLMQVLWEIGRGTVQAVLDGMPGKEKPAYTTVQTMLNILEQKGKVRRQLQDRAYVYRPAVTRTQAVSATMRDLIDRMFGGSAEALVLGLLETKHITPEKLAALQKKLDAKK
ncbi:hypothetical protein F183_A16340 [Bryobacterales bacterium F-183]|nr:hypothetical protein F183_A16340 [Bryobacterales bacterium F-183]